MHSEQDIPIKETVRRLLLAVLLLVLIAPAALAQGGTLTGTVKDSEDNTPLMGATIRIEGTGLGAVSDLDGKYTIANIPAGTYTVVVSYISYVTRNISGREIKAGGSYHLDITLSADNELLDEVVVETKGNSESETMLLLQQKQTLIATQAIGSKELSRKGISDAESAVAQISGVSRQDGEKNVFVRGLPDRYNATLLNGFPIPSDDPEYKNISLEIFDTDMIRNISVAKAFSSQIGGDVGGAVIDIQSKELVGDRLLELSASVGGNSSVIGNDFYKQDGTNYFGVSRRERPGQELFDPMFLRRDVGNPFANRLHPTRFTGPVEHALGAKLGKRFDLGANSLALLLVANHSVGYSHSKRISRALSVADSYGIMLKDLSGQTSTIDTRQMVLGNALLELGHKHTIEYNLFFIHSDDQYVNRLSGLDAVNDTPEQNFQIDQLRQQANDNYLVVNQLDTNWELADKLRMNAGVAANIIRAYEPDRRTLSFWKKENGWVPNPSSDNKRFYSDLTENDYIARTRLDWEYTKGSTLSAGYTFRDITHTFAAFQYSYYSSGLTFDEAGKDTANWDEIYRPEYLANGKTAHPGAWVEYGNTEWYTADRQSHTAFVEVAHRFSESLSAQAGVRLDIVDQVVTHGMGQKVGDAPVAYPAYYTPFWLPSFNIRYDLNDKHTLRLSMARSYTLARFKETAPYRYVNIGYSSEGNPGIKPSDIWSIDLKYDWYISPTELFSATLFYKNIHNPLSRVFKGGTAGILEYANPSDYAHAAGVEVEVKKDLVNVYDPMTERRHKVNAGLSASALLTTMTLKIEVPYVEPRKSQLEGASPWLLNADLSYTYTQGEKSYGLTALLHYYHDRIHTYGTIGGNQYDLIEQGMASLNLVMQADLAKNLTLKLKGNNLLDSPVKLKQRASDSLVQSHGNNIYSKPGDPYDGTNLVGPIPMNEFRKGISFSLGLGYRF